MIRKNKNSEEFLLHKASIFRPKLGKLLWRMWKDKIFDLQFEPAPAKPTRPS